MGWKTTVIGDLWRTWMIPKCIWVQVILLIIQNQIYTIQNLQRSPIPQTINWSGTFFAVSYSKPALRSSLFSHFCLNLDAFLYFLKFYLILGGWSTKCLRLNSFHFSNLLTLLTPLGLYSVLVVFDNKKIWNKIEDYLYRNMFHSSRLPVWTYFIV